MYIMSPVFRIISEKRLTLGLTNRVARRKRAYHMQVAAKTCVRAATCTSVQPPALSIYGSA